MVVDALTPYSVPHEIAASKAEPEHRMTVAAMHIVAAAEALFKHPLAPDDDISLYQAMTAMAAALNEVGQEVLAAAAAETGNGAGEYHGTLGKVN